MLKDKLKELENKWKGKPMPPRASKEWFERMADRIKYRNLLKELENSAEDIYETAKKIFS